MSEEQAGARPAGWYPHPTMAGTQAYWDGTVWTEHVAPAAAPGSDATSSAAKVFLLLVAVGVVVVMIVVAGALGK